MKKIISVLLMMCTILALCGCSTSLDNITDNYMEQNYNEGDSGIETGSEEPSIVGLWQHTEYPDAYSIRINSLEGRELNFTIEAVKGNGSQIATAEVDNAYFSSNKARFAFTDSFNNFGIGEIKIVGDEMTVSYETNTPYQGSWCIDAGAGIYKKSNGASKENNVGDNHSINHESNIDHNIVGTWINQKSTYILEKLVLLADGTGFWDSESIYWKVKDNMIIFRFPNKTVDYGYRLENSKLYIDNGSQLIKIDGKQQIKMSSLLNMRWVPDFVSYPNNYHVDNPVLKLVHVSNDETKLVFVDDFGVSYTATTENGWRYFFEDDKLFYGFNLYGLDPEEGYDVPTMFVDVTNGGWYTVIYKLEE